MLHSPRVYSDHRPVLLGLSKELATDRAKGFQFLSLRILHEGFKDLVRSSWSHGDCYSASIKHFMEDVKVWNKCVFGHIDTRKQNLLVKINKI